MKKDFLIFLKHILESIELIEDYVKDITEKKFLSYPQKQDAVIRRIEIIGKAIKIFQQNSRIGIQRFHGERSPE